MAKKTVKKILMCSTAEGSSYRYTARKQNSNKTKLAFKSYDPTPHVRKHVLFQEEKMR